MKVAYILNTPRAASYKVQSMILPQLEAGTHGVEVVGIFFFDDNAYALRAGDRIGERLAIVAKQTGMLLMACDTCALERNLAEGEPRWCDPATRKGRSSPVECAPVGLVDGATVGCFPDLYTALSTNTMPIRWSRSEASLRTGSSGYPWSGRRRPRKCWRQPGSKP